jgi:hypothetical protein
MNQPRNSDVVDRVRAVRPEPPAELLDPRSEGARLLFQQVVAEPRAAVRPRRWPRVVAGVSAAAAVAALGLLVALPERADSPAAVSVASEAPRPTPASNHTATAVLTVDGQSQELTLEGDNVSSRIAPLDESGTWIENRVVDGVVYLYLPGADGEPEWTFDPDDTTTLSDHPTGATPFELYESIVTADVGQGGVQRSIEFSTVESDTIDGIPVNHVRAVDVAGLDPTLLPMAGSGGNLDAMQSLDLWITEDNIVLRLEATASRILGHSAEIPVSAPDEFATGSVVVQTAPPPPPTEHPIDPDLLTYTLEFHDVGTDIAVDVPQGAVEMDAEG